MSVRHQLLKLSSICQLIAFLLVAASGAAQAQYRLDSGDVLEVAVFGVADFKRRVTVNVDGDVSVPFLGEVGARGLSLSELRQRLAAGLAAKGSIRDPDVTIELVEYRPYYITGDVSRPGAHPYRPGLTVRHAVALAGGYDALRFRAENPLLLAPELRSQYEAQWMDLVKRKARALGLQAQLDGKDTVDMKVLEDAPVPHHLIQEVAKLETADMKMRIGDFEKEDRHLATGIARTDQSIAEFEDALKKLDQHFQQQVQASARVEGYQAKGVATVNRVEEERRALAMMRMQQLETVARLATARKEREDLDRRRQRGADEYRAQIVRNLKDIAVEIEQARSRIRGVGERLLYAGAVKAQMRRGGPGPEFVIYRKTDNGPVTIQASEDREVLPGDVVDVLIRPDQLVIAPKE